MKNRLTYEAVAELLWTGMGQVATAKLLREREYVFSDKAFRFFWHKAMSNWKQQKPVPAPVEIPEPQEAPPAAGTVLSADEYRKTITSRRYVLTCAQNNTKLHDGFWAALENYVEFNKATLIVGTITYNKAGWAKRGGTSKAGETEEDTALWYDERVKSYILDEQIKIAPGLVWCGELDVSPSASDPLSGLNSYSGPNSAIIPHTKHRLKSLPTMKGDVAKMLYTTGVVTQRNYIERKTGQLANFHHIYGAVVVEVDEDGVWFARHINAADDGSFIDLDMRYDSTGCYESVSRPTVVLGDIHIEKMDILAVNGALQMMGTLKPDTIMVHDLIDFTERNHHNLRDPHFLARQFYSGNFPVEKCFKDAAAFLSTVHAVVPDADIYIVRSNHDEAYERWVRDGSGFVDTVNARFWHESNAAYYMALERGEKNFDLFAWALSRFTKQLGETVTDQINMLRADDSFVRNGIQYAIHGHLGANGGKASSKVYDGSGRKVSDAHTHSAGIEGGRHTAGVLGKLDMGYNRGLSSWSQSNGITYGNGKRAILTQHGARWRGKDL